MEKKFRITVEGKQYIVAVEDISTEETQSLYPAPGTMSMACLLYTSPSPRDGLLSRMPSSA